MRTPRLFLGIFALALLLPLMLMACGGSNEPSSKRATAEPATPAAAATATVPPTATDAPAAPAASGSAETDREALVALYNATDGPNWTYNENWLINAPLGKWEGVTTNDDGRVTKLELGGNAVSGEIPAELGSLSNLIDLHLKDTDLSGCVPGSLENQLFVNVSDFPFC